MTSIPNGSSFAVAVASKGKLDAANLIEKKNMRAFR